MQRVSVVGSSGSGKTTMARALGERLGLPVLELDSVYHLPHWTPLGGELFRQQVGEFAAAERWVIDGNYTSHGINDIVWERADTVVWMDLSRRTVMRRVVVRSLSRAATGEELWNGNRERWSNLLRWAPEENVVRWSWTRFDPTRDKYERRLASNRWRHLTAYRLRSPAAAIQLLDSLPGPDDA